MNVTVEISIGEFFDKVTILEIKKERIQQADKLANIEKELDALNALLDTIPKPEEKQPQQITVH